MISKCKCDEYYTCKACRLGEGLTYQQIANDLGISHQAVWEIEKRALNKLGKLLKTYNLTIRDLLL
jgi:DNA-directed RNA polymerase specialized sigma24 family protein